MPNSSEIARILFISDIYGKEGKKAVFHRLPYYIENKAVSFVIANGENIAGGFGITGNLAEKLFSYGIDVITSGNHFWDRRDEIIEMAEKNDRILRPANYPDTLPGFGSTVMKDKNGISIGVINIQGRVFMPPLDSPFRIVKEEIESVKEKAKIIIVDFHAEATSEKKAMAYWLKNDVSALIGTHTHIQTADETIFPEGMAYITDAGMTGVQDSVIGTKPDCAVEHFVTSLNVRFEPAKGNPHFCALLIDISPQTGKAINIERIREFVPYGEYDDND